MSETRTHNSTHQITSGGVTHDDKGHFPHQCKPLSTASGRMRYATYSTISAISPAPRHLACNHHPRPSTYPASLSDPGNMTADGKGLTFAYGLFDDELISIDTDGDGLEDITYTYDALGRRVSSTENGITTIFVCAGDQIVQDYTGDNINGYSLDKSYVYGGYIDEPLAHIDHASSNAKSYYHRDRRYNVTALSDQAGVITQRYGYDSYGKRKVLDANGSADTNPAKTRYGFTGREHEAGAEDLMYFRSRYFHTTLGRFTKHDVDYLDGLNLYAGYFGERGGVDPWGMHYYRPPPGSEDVDPAAALGKLLRDTGHFNRTRTDLEYDVLVRHGDIFEVLDIYFDTKTTSIASVDYAECDKCNLNVHEKIDHYMYSVIKKGEYVDIQNLKITVWQHRVDYWMEWIDRASDVADLVQIIPDKATDIADGVLLGSDLILAGLPHEVDYEWGEVTRHESSYEYIKENHLYTERLYLTNTFESIDCEQAQRLADIINGG